MDAVLPQSSQQSQDPKTRQNMMGNQNRNNGLMVKSKSNVLETVDNLCNPSIRAQGDQDEQNCQFFDENDFFSIRGSFIYVYTYNFWDNLPSLFYKYAITEIKI